MAKKKTSPEESATSDAPVRRRAPSPKKKSPEPPRADEAAAAPPVDLASVIGTERLATASDTGASSAPAQAQAAADREPTQEEIAEAAYFRHLRRGAHEGDEFNDWVEAERELRERRRR